MGENKNDEEIGNGRSEMDEKHLIDLIDDITDEYEFNWNNGEYDIDFESQTGYLIVESPWHSTRYVDLDPIVSYIVEHKLDATPENDKLISGNIKRAIADCLEDYSADEEFDELYEPVTSNPNNHFTPSEFLRILQNSEDFFKDVADKLRHAAYGIPDLENAD